MTFLHSCAQDIELEGKPAFVYYFGDYDPSGLDISRNIEKRLNEFAPNSEITFERVAVTPAQIKDWNLPTRPTKRSDTRAKSFRGKSVEVDAIEPHRLRSLVRGCIERHKRYLPCNCKSPKPRVMCKSGCTTLVRRLTTIGAIIVTLKLGAGARLKANGWI